MEEWVREIVKYVEKRGWKGLREGEILGEGME